MRFVPFKLGTSLHIRERGISETLNAATTSQRYIGPSPKAFKLMPKVSSQQDQDPKSTELGCLL